MCPAALGGERSGGARCQSSLTADLLFTALTAPARVCFLPPSAFRFLLKVACLDLAPKTVRERRHRGHRRGGGSLPSLPFGCARLARGCASARSYRSRPRPRRWMYCSAAAAAALFSACEGLFQGSPRDQASRAAGSPGIQPCSLPVFHHVHLWQLFNLEDCLRVSSDCLGKNIL